MNKNESVGNIIWLDNLRVFSTLSVIIIHVSFCLFYQYGSIPNSFWYIGLFYDGFARFSVPVFLMISGNLLLGKEEEIHFFIIKRINRIIYPFLFWLSIYIILNYNYFVVPEGQNLSYMELLKSVFLILKVGPYHFWYIYMILGIYLFIPIIRKWVQNSSLNELLYFLIIWFITILFKMPKINILRVSLDLTNFTGYFGYVLLGYYLSRSEFLVGKKTTFISVFLIVIGFISTVFLSYNFTVKQGHSIDFYFDFLTPNVCILAIGVFLLFKSVSFNKKNNLVSFFSKYSYGIFLIHLLVLNYLARIGIDAKFIHPILGIPITSILCIFISAGIVYGINKIPFGKYISG
jgi:surface polysaccharide O-acyltransferase-like enzyme